MRFLLYNIRYGTGGRRRLPWSGYLCRTASNLSSISSFLAAQQADVMGLIEVDAGTYRTHRMNQAETLATSLGHYHTYTSKYGQSSLMRLLPMTRMLGNAFLTKDTVQNTVFHYFDKGVKRLVIELEMENLVVFLVHLSLSFRVRHHQLGDLYNLVNGTDKPHIVAGDFNALWGDREMGLFLAATKLTNANTAAHPTFPSWAPRRQLDLVLYSEGIRVTRFEVPQVLLSDHLPLVMDFDIGT